MVVLDGVTAFVGGLDLCYGRWDNAEHALFPAHDGLLFPGADYYHPGHNAVTKQHLQAPQKDVLDRHSMPAFIHKSSSAWGDCCCVTNPSVVSPCE